MNALLDTDEEAEEEYDSDKENMKHKVKKKVVGEEEADREKKARMGKFHNLTQLRKKSRIAVSDEKPGEKKDTGTSKTARPGRRRSADKGGGNNSVVGKKAKALKRRLCLDQEDLRRDKQLRLNEEATDRDTTVVKQNDPPTVNNSGATNQGGAQVSEETDKKVPHSKRRHSKLLDSEDESYLRALIAAKGVRSEDEDLVLDLLEEPLEPYPRATSACTYDNGLEEVQDGLHLPSFSSPGLRNFREEMQEIPAAIIDPISPSSSSSSSGECGDGEDGGEKETKKSKKKRNLLAAKLKLKMEQEAKRLAGGSSPLYSGSNEYSSSNEEDTTATAKKGKGSHTSSRKSLRKKSASKQRGKEERLSSPSASPNRQRTGKNLRALALQFSSDSGDSCKETAGQRGLPGRGHKGKGSSKLRAMKVINPVGCSSDNEERRGKGGKSLEKVLNTTLEEDEEIPERESGKGDIDPSSMLEEAELRAKDVNRLSITSVSSSNETSEILTSMYDNLPPNESPAHPGEEDTLVELGGQIETRPGSACGKPSNPTDGANKESHLADIDAVLTSNLDNAELLLEDRAAGDLLDTGDMPLEEPFPEKGASDPETLVESPPTAAEQVKVLFDDSGSSALPSSANLLDLISNMIEDEEDLNTLSSVAGEGQDVSSLASSSPGTEGEPPGLLEGSAPTDNNISAQNATQDSSNQEEELLDTETATPAVHIPPEFIPGIDQDQEDLVTAVNAAKNANLEEELRKENNQKQPDKIQSGDKSGQSTNESQVEIERGEGACVSRGRGNYHSGWEKAREEAKAAASLLGLTMRSPRVEYYKNVSPIKSPLYSPTEKMAKLEQRMTKPSNKLLYSDSNDQNSNKNDSGLDSGVEGNLPMTVTPKENDTENGPMPIGGSPENEISSSKVMSPAVQMASPLNVGSPLKEKETVPIPEYEMNEQAQYLEKSNKINIQPKEKTSSPDESATNITSPSLEQKQEGGSSASSTIPGENSKTDDDSNSHTPKPICEEGHMKNDDNFSRVHNCLVQRTLTVCSPTNEIQTNSFETVPSTADEITEEMHFQKDSKKTNTSLKENPGISDESATSVNSGSLQQKQGGDSSGATTSPRENSNINDGGNSHVSKSICVGRHVENDDSSPATQNGSVQSKDPSMFSSPTNEKETNSFEIVPLTVHGITGEKHSQKDSKKTNTSPKENLGISDELATSVNSGSLQQKQGDDSSGATTSPRENSNTNHGGNSHVPKSICVGRHMENDDSSPALQNDSVQSYEPLTFSSPTNDKETNSFGIVPSTVHGITAEKHSRESSKNTKTLPKEKTVIPDEPTTSVIAGSLSKQGNNSSTVAMSPKENANINDDGNSQVPRPICIGSHKENDDSSSTSQNCSVQSNVPINICSPTKEKEMDCFETFPTGSDEKTEEGQSLVNSNNASILDTEKTRIPDESTTSQITDSLVLTPGGSIKATANPGENSKNENGGNGRIPGLTSMADNLENDTAPKIQNCSVQKNSPSSVKEKEADSSELIPPASMEKTENKKKNAVTNLTPTEHKTVSNVVTSANATTGSLHQKQGGSRSTATAVHTETYSTFCDDSPSLRPSVLMKIAMETSMQLDNIDLCLPTQNTVKARHTTELWKASVGNILPEIRALPAPRVGILDKTKPPSSLPCSTQRHGKEKPTQAMSTSQPTLQREKSGPKSPPYLEPIVSKETPPDARVQTHPSAELSIASDLFPEAHSRKIVEGMPHTEAPLSSHQTKEPEKNSCSLPDSENISQTVQGTMPADPQSVSHHRPVQEQTCDPKPNVSNNKNEMAGGVTEAPIAAKPTLRTTDLLKKFRPARHRRHSERMKGMSLTEGTVTTETSTEFEKTANAMPARIDATARKSLGSELDSLGVTNPFLRGSEQIGANAPTDTSALQNPGTVSVVPWDIIPGSSTATSRHESPTPERIIRPSLLSRNRGIIDNGTVNMRKNNPTQLPRLELSSKTREKVVQNDPITGSLSLSNNKKDADINLGKRQILEDRAYSSNIIDIIPQAEEPMTIRGCQQRDGGSSLPSRSLTNGLEMRYVPQDVIPQQQQLLSEMASRDCSPKAQNFPPENAFESRNNTTLEWSKPSEIQQSKGEGIICINEESIQVNVQSYAKRIGEQPYSYVEPRNVSLGEDGEGPLVIEEAGSASPSPRPLKIADGEPGKGRHREIEVVELSSSDDDQEEEGESICSAGNFPPMNYSKFTAELNAKLIKLAKERALLEMAEISAPESSANESNSISTSEKQMTDSSAFEESNANESSSDKPGQSSSHVVDLVDSDDSPSPAPVCEVNETKPEPPSSELVILEETGTSIGRPPESPVFKMPALQSGGVSEKYPFSRHRGSSTTNSSRPFAFPRRQESSFPQSSLARESALERLRNARRKCQQQESSHKGLPKHAAMPPITFRKRVHTDLTSQAGISLADLRKDIKKRPWESSPPKKSKPGKNDSASDPEEEEDRSDAFSCVSSVMPSLRLGEISSSSGDEEEEQQQQQQQQHSLCLIIFSVRSAVVYA